ncbi:hypothetical protein MAFF241647_05290 [Ralstonia solanacearum]|nr:hypothetical protein MAFF241647_05290 [Ralstonia solanacearum]
MDKLGSCRMLLASMTTATADVCPQRAEQEEQGVDAEVLKGGCVGYHDGSMEKRMGIGAVAFHCSPWKSYVVEKN